ncbi:GspE/PulE/PilB domain-containing protein [Geomonas azotofigens]|uniref:GspE/PulE/PilB domain-containing protein n=1 Tax=Geomonas azotofigens TaxID=2843196 RepID=UPI001C125BAC|nr:general secretion pathway protein GspE [Geomonas azotofigens]MBU5611701.1 general secretion pathway protein GspE [Geomonas azotofigens]
MAARLGEMLLRIGALDASQLEQVLNAQAIYGGRLGTNLVEMGLVEEDQLARVLSEQLGVPCMDNDLLVAIPHSLLELLPLELVARYRVLPVSLDGKRLVVAMADPSDFKALDEIGFITGLVILPRVCSELRLSIALERFYGIKRPMRFIPVQGGVRSRFAPADLQPAVLEDDPEGTAQPERISLADLADRLAAASAEQEAVQALLCYVAGEFDRGALVKLKNDNLVGVQAVAAGVPVPGFCGCALSLREAPQLQRVVRERNVFLGEVSAGAEGALLRAMGGELPGAALLVPLTLGGQVAGVICAHDSHGRLGGGAFELQRVAVMAELSLEMITLRKRIVSG